MLKVENLIAVLQQLGSNGVMSTSELASKLKLTEQKVRYWLKTMTADGLLVETEKGYVLKSRVFLINDDSLVIVVKKSGVVTMLGLPSEEPDYSTVNYKQFSPKKA